ncbi:MAG: FAD-dependent oxidoreductase [Gemmatimonadetes bacterium]|nr:FAD-dependent oxidoreductase [Gemmatimonadota bacterium]
MEAGRTAVHLVTGRFSSLSWARCLHGRPGMSNSVRVAIIGAGPAGLTAARELLREGVNVVVFEADPWVGGKTRTDRLDGYQIDASAQLFGSMYTRFLALVDELGIRDRLVRSPGRDALWRNGRMHEVVYGSVSSMLASGGLPLKTKLRLGATYLPFLTRHGADLDLHAPERAAAAGLDGESIASWGEREMGSEFIDYLVYPQLTGYYGALPEETGAGLYHVLARYGVDVAVFALQGGAATLCEVLAERVRAGGGEVRLGTRVDALETSSGGTTLSVAGASERFDGVVVATQAPPARELLRASHPALAGWLDGVRTRPALTVGLLLDRPAGVRYFGLSFPKDEASAVAAICVQENKGVDLVPEGRGALVTFVRPDVAPGLLGADGRTILDAILPDVRRAFPGLESHITRARVYRWPAGNPIVYPGYLAHLGTFRQGGVEKNERVVLAGDYLYTPSVEGAVTAGTTAARRLRERLTAS